MAEDNSAKKPEKIASQAQSTKKEWNVVQEVLRRDHCAGSQQDNASFTRDCYGSPHIVKRMKLSHHLEQPPGTVEIMNFNKRGDLLCTGCSYDDGKSNNIGLVNWSENKVKATLNTENNGKLSDINFLTANNYENQSSIVSVYENGRFRCDCLTPTGLIEALHSQQLTVERHKLALCPDSQHEVLSAAANGEIFNIDLRCAQQNKNSVNILANVKPFETNVKLQSISHHPFRPQICASFDDYHVRIFDKRQFDRPVHEICPVSYGEGGRKPSKPAQISDSFYSYDGSEILAIFTDTEIYLLDSENKRPGEVKQSYPQYGYLAGFTNKTCFFGPKSEYVVDGDDGQRITFMDKITGKRVGFTALWPHGRFCSVYFLDLKSHPHLPVVAASAGHFSILRPTSAEEDAKKEPKKKTKKTAKSKREATCGLT